MTPKHQWLLKTYACIEQWNDGEGSTQLNLFILGSCAHFAENPKKSLFFFLWFNGKTLHHFPFPGVSESVRAAWDSYEGAPILKASQPGRRFCIKWVPNMFSVLWHRTSGKRGNCFFCWCFFGSRHVINTVGTVHLVHCTGKGKPEWSKGHPLCIIVCFSFSDTELKEHYNRDTTHTRCLSLLLVLDRKVELLCSCYCDVNSTAAHCVIVAQHNGWLLSDGKNIAAVYCLT